MTFAIDPDRCRESVVRWIDSAARSVARLVFYHGGSAKNSIASNV